MLNAFGCECGSKVLNSLLAVTSCNCLISYWVHQCRWLFVIVLSVDVGLLLWLSGKESSCQGRRLGFDSWVRKIPWRRKRQLTPVFLSAKSNEQRSPDKLQFVASQKNQTRLERLTHTPWYILRLFYLITQHPFEVGIIYTLIDE